MVYILSERRRFGAGADMWLQSGLASQAILLDTTRKHPASGRKNSWPCSAFGVLRVGARGIPGLEEWTRGEIQQPGPPGTFSLSRSFCSPLLQAWGRARSWTVNRVKSKNCPTLQFTANMPSGTSAQELDSSTRAGTGGQHLWGEMSAPRSPPLLLPLFPPTPSLTLL